MIHFTTGDIFNSKAQALVNPVNLQGVMGKGLALEFKQRFPENFAAYLKACIFKEIGIGKVLIFQENNKYVVNFPTKDHYRNPSKLCYITSGLENLTNQMVIRGIQSVAIPKLGCGLGGLKWDDVLSLIIHEFRDSPLDIFIYE